MSRFVRIRLKLGVACLAALSWQTAMAQTKPATATASAPAPAKPDLSVLKLIPPKDVLGFVAVGNAEAFADKVGALAKLMMGPDGPPANFLDQIRQGAELGETFRPKGSFAAVLLDPRKYRPELARKVEKEQRDSVHLDMDPRKFPAAFLIPGTDPAKMFGRAAAAQDGKYVKLTDKNGGGDPAWALDAKTHVILAFDAKVLDAFSRASAAAPRQAEWAEMLARHDVVVWFDRKMCEKFRDTHLGVGFLNVIGFGGRFMPFGNPAMMPIRYVLATREKIFSEAVTLAFGLTLDNAGIVVEARWGYPADSVVGKALTLLPAKPGPLMTRLPAKLPYLFLYGATKDFKTPAKLKAEQYAELVKTELLKAAAPEVKAKAVKLVLALQEQVTAVQHYFGPNGKTPGLGLISVVECKSPKAFMKIIRDIPPVAQALMESLDNDEFKKITFEYVQNMETVGKVTADAILVKHPDMAEMDEEALNRMKGMIGDDKMRALFAVVDAKTVVISAGGGLPLLTAAIQAAQAKPKALEDDPSIRLALARLPRRRCVVAIVNIANGLKAMSDMASAMGSGPAPFVLNCKVPLAGAVSVDKTNLSFTAHVPLEPIKEIFDTMRRAREAP